MNKKQLISALATRAEIKKTEAERLLVAYIEVLTSALNEGEAVELVGFGSFRPVEQKPRQARNPRTGDLLMVPGRRTVRFKAGKLLLDGMNNKNN